LRVCLLASGSQGNAIFIETPETGLLLDAGLSAKELNRRLELIGSGGEHLHGLLVSHEHQDHCRGIGPLSRRYNIPVFMHPKTRQVLPQLGRLDDHREFDAGLSFRYRDLDIETIPLTHDAELTVGYVISTGAGNIGVVTDLGLATRLVADRLRGCRVLILESNHDEELLRDGPYPWHLKQRIKSNHGHLSNRACAALLQELLWEGLEAVFLAHMSETNNTPAHALDCAAAVLDNQSICRPQLVLGRQNSISQCLQFG